VAKLVTAGRLAILRLDLRRGLAWVTLLTMLRLTWSTAGTLARHALLTWQPRLSRQALLTWQPRLSRHALLTGQAGQARQALVAWQALAWSLLAWPLLAWPLLAWPAGLIRRLRAGRNSALLADWVSELGRPVLALVADPALADHSVLAGPILVDSALTRRALV